MERRAGGRGKKEGEEGEGGRGGGGRGEGGMRGEGTQRRVGEVWHTLVCVECSEEESRSWRG